MSPLRKRLESVEDRIALRQHRELVRHPEGGLSMSCSSFIDIGQRTPAMSFRAELSSGCGGSRQSLSVNGKN